MKMRIKMVFKKVSNLFNNVLEYTTLKQEIKYLRKELEESKTKERPYIDKITKLQGDNRVLKIINTKLEKKNMQLEDQLKHFKE